MCVLLMKRYLILFFFIIVGWGYSLAQSWSADNGNGTYTNPIFYDECSDPDIIRVGEDFYLTSTTMHSVPGLPVLHSKDLVNWELLSYALTEFDLGEERLKKAENFATKQDIADLFDEQDMKEVNVDISIVDIVISVGAASSKREAREFITSGAVSLNGNKITDINQIISADMFIDNTYVIIKRGKKNYYVGKKI